MKSTGIYRLVLARHLLKNTLLKPSRLLLWKKKSPLRKIFRGEQIQLPLSFTQFISEFP